MNANTPQAHIDNARAKLTTLLDKLCASSRAEEPAYVESITKVAQTLHYLCAPPFPGSLAVAPEPKPEPEPLTGQGETNAPTNAVGPEPTPGPDPKSPFDSFIAALRTARENCQCPLCTARRQAEAKAQAEAGAEKPSIGGDMSASALVVEIPINGDIAAAIARAVGLNG